MLLSNWEFAFIFILLAIGVAAQICNGEPELGWDEDRDKTDGF